MYTLTWIDWAKDKNKHENFIVLVTNWEMLVATKLKISGSEKKKTNRNTCNTEFLHKMCNSGSFILYFCFVLFVSLFVCLVFFLLFSLSSPLSITQFYFFLWVNISQGYSDERSQWNICNTVEPCSMDTHFVILLTVTPKYNGQLHLSW